MANGTNTSFLAARCSRRLKKKARDLKSATGVDESDMILTAVTEFFSTYKTREAQIAAVSRYRVAAAR